MNGDDEIRRHDEERARAWSERGRQWQTGDSDTDRLIRTLLERGTSPAYHSQQLQRLRNEWPTLATVLRDILEHNGAPMPHEWRHPPVP